MQVTLSGAALTHLPQAYRFAIAAAAGFDGLELVITPELWQRGAQYAMMLAEKYELPILTLHPPMQRMGWDFDDWYINSMQMAMQIPTCRAIVFHTPVTAFWESRHGRMYLESIRRCRAMSDRVRISIETANADLRSKDGGSAKMPLIYGYEELLRFAEDEDLSITFDTCHASTMPEGMLSAYELLRSRIDNIHFSDMRDEQNLPGIIAGTGPIRRFFLRHYTPGSGRLPLVTFIRQVVQDQYQGTLTFEETPVAMPFWSIQSTTEHLQRSLQYWRDVIAAASSMKTGSIDK